MSDILETRDPDTLRATNRLLVVENERLHQRLGELTARIADLTGKKPAEQLALELSLLKEQMAALAKKIFGDSSERRDKKTDKSGEPKNPQRGHGPTPQPDLPVVVTPVVLASEDRVCPECNCVMEPWTGQTEDSELIDVLRQQILLRKIQRQKYRCRCGVGVKTAPVPLKHVPRGRYSLDFVAHTATDKFANHIPLDRQRRMMRRLGLHVTSQTLWDQTNALARDLEPIYHALRDYIIGADVIGADETWWRLMNKKPSKRWWVWSITTPDAAWYQTDESRSAKTAADVVKGFEGTIICDGYSAYETLARGSPALRLALCWSHVRRKFVEAEPNYPECSEAIELCGKLFAIDRDTKDPSLCSGDEKAEAVAARRRERKERAPQILADLRSWALCQRGLPKSALRKAIHYMLGHWDRLNVFVDDPFVPLSTNDTERAIRGVVIGRKNHLGSRSRRGAKVAAVFYSLLETAIRNGVDPHAYLIGATYGVHYGDDPAKLLPLKHLWPES